MFTTSFDPALAKKIGVEAAVLYSWLKQQAEIEHMRSNDATVKISNEMFESLFSFWKIDKVHKLLTKLEKHELITAADGAYTLKVNEKKKRRVPQAAPKQVRMITYKDETGQEITKSSNDLIAELIDEFKHVNPDYGKFFKWKTQRDALDDMLDTWNVQLLFQLIRVLPMSNKEMYMPTITKPTEFRANAAKLLAEVQGKQMFNQAQQVNVR